MTFEDVRNTLITAVKSSNAYYNIKESRSTFSIETDTVTIEQLGAHYGDLHITSAGLSVTINLEDIKEISDASSGAAGVFVEGNFPTLRIYFNKY